MKPFYQIVIMGRPNTGKSTLFNRLVGRRRALVHDEPGVTRDRMEELTEWVFNLNPSLLGKKAAPKIVNIPIKVVDTGGLGGDRFADEIEEQVRIATGAADLILFLFDSQVGMTPLDEELLARLHRSGLMRKVPVLGVVNKVDAEMHEDRIADFYGSGLGEILTISAEHNRGIDDLKQAILSSVLPSIETLSAEFSKEFSKNLASGEFEDSMEFTEPKESDTLLGELPEELREELSKESQESPDRIPRIAIVGRPNVGKSTLVNAILGVNRMITSPIAGTTVDAVDSVASLGPNERPFIWVDTAGIRRKSKTEQGIEVLSVVQTRKALEKANVAILVLDGETGITDQDEKIGGLIEEAGCGVVLLVNKWDTQARNAQFPREVAAETIRKEMGFLQFAPILFVSALKHQGLENLGHLLEEIIHQRKLKISTHEFTEWVRERSLIHNPQNAKFFLCHQSGRHPPTFVCHVNDPDRVHFSLRRHLVNAMREKWGYMGNPIRLLFVKANRRSLPKPKKNPRSLRVQRSQKTS